jgi:predicted nucleic acid-binding protein
MKVTLDTNFLIWGVRGESSPGQEHLIPIAQAIISKLKASDDRVVLTAIVVAEYLSGTPEDKFDAEFAEIHKSFQVLPFDAKAAKIAAKLWQSRHKLIQSIGKSRNVIKADIQLVATARAHDVNRVYSGDADVLSYAGSLHMVPVEIPNEAPSKPKKSLFDEEG